MSVIFCGGEVEDFAITGAVTSELSVATYRNTHARMSTTITGSATWNANFARVSLSALTSFALTARLYFGTVIATPFLWFSTGGNARLRLRFASASPALIVLESWDGASAATLATSSSAVLASTLYRLDIQVTYGTSGRFTLYVNGALYLDYTGDITVAGATSINSIEFGPGRGTASIGCQWSEVIVTDGEDPRPLTLKTLVPNGAGDLSAWTGAFGDVDEYEASSTDLVSSGTAGQETNFDCTGMPSGGGNLSVRLVKVVASGLRGSGGPQKIQLGVKSGSTSGYSADLALTTGFTAVSNSWTLNPATGSAFTAAEIDSLKLAVKSIA